MPDRRRLGVIVPSSNTIAEVDFVRAAPPDVTVHVARMYLAETTAAAERRMLDHHLPQAAIDLGSAHPDVVVFSCTSAAAILGGDGEVALIERLALDTGAPVVSTNTAVSENLARHGSHVAIFTPYNDELTGAIADSLRTRRFNVGKVVGLGMTDNFAIADLTPDRIVSIVESEFASEDFEVLFLSCTNLRSVEALPALERRLERPVVTSNAAAIREALAILSSPEPAGISA